MKKHIVFSNFDDIKNPYYAGGGAIAVHHVAKRLTSQYTVTVITGNYPGAKNQRVDGVWYERIGPAGVGPRLGQVIFQFLLPWYVIHRSFDCWLESYTPPFATAFLPWFTKKPVIGITHFLDADAKQQQYRLPFQFIENFGIKQYQSIITMTRAMKEKIAQTNPRAAITIIPNGIEPIPTPTVSKARIPYILYLGRIEIAQKGLDLLLAAFALVAPKMRAHLYIAGSGVQQDEKHLRMLIEKYHLQSRVRITGKVAGTQKMTLMAQALGVVIPSRHETQSLVALEALAAGKPIICFDIVGLRWLTRATTRKAKPFSIGDFAKQIQYLCTHTGARGTTQQQSFRQSKQYNWDTIARKYQRVIQTQINQQSFI